MSLSLIVRSASSSDNNAITSLLGAAQQEMAQYRGQFTDVISGDHTIVAVCGDSVVGVAQYLVSPPESALITCIHVHSDAREVGVGDTLLQHLLSELRSQNVKWVSAHAQPGDRALKNLFERHGLVAQSILVGKSL